MGSKNRQKSYILHSGHPEDPLWLFGVTPMPKYGQKLTFLGGYMVTYEIVGVVNFIKLSTFSLPIRIIFVKSIPKLFSIKYFTTLLL